MRSKRGEWMQTALVIGGAGTGKTTELLRIMDKILKTDVRDPMRVAFISFTRAARGEAAQRAGDQFGISVDTLEQKGWFKTIHSVCHKVLGVGEELLCGDADSRKWISEALDEQVTAAITGMDGDISESFEVSTEAGRCLHIWDVARSKLVPVSEVWEWCDMISPSNTPHLGEVVRIIKLYEEKKQQDGRWDFTDTLLRVAGVRHRIDGVEEVEPEGHLPILPVWFFDEQQDTSKLADLVCRRLVIGARWVYLMGDPFQSIYGFAGADSRYFQNWNVAPERRRTLDRSFRCPSNILEAGESILRPCTDYWDRGIKPNEEGGTVDDDSFLGGWEEEINPNDSWLCLARTNRMAFKMGKMLDDAGIPWGSTEGKGSKAPLKAAAIGAIYDLSRGGVVDGHQWAKITKVLPSKFEGIPLFERGTKKRFEDKDEAKKYEFMPPARISEMGATSPLIAGIRNGMWKDFVPDCSDLITACDKWGAGVLINPQVRVGTIHSVKGMEADNVAVLTSQTQAIWNAMDDPRGADEERRVWYVAATRARNRLLWLNDYRDRMRFDPSN